jgi:hypothetical protein
MREPPVPAIDLQIFADDNSHKPSEVISVDITVTAAKARACRLATKHQAPVDVRLPGYKLDDPDGYLGTATPYYGSPSLGASFRREV